MPNRPHSHKSRPVQNERSGFRQKAALFNFQELRRSAETPLRLMGGFAEVSNQKYVKDEDENDDEED